MPSDRRHSEGPSKCVENLRLARKNRDLSQEELAFRARLHRTEISALERGLREPRLSVLVKLAAALDVSAEAFFEGIEWRRSKPREASPGRFHVSPNSQGQS